MRKNFGIITVGTDEYAEGERMSATDELRRMLDERGVEWTKPKSATEFIQTTFLCNGWGIEVLERNIGLCVTATNIFDTPERAISATLGGEERTCHIEGRYGNKYCTYCGEMVGTWDSTSELYVSGNMVELWSYCPNCGAKVVEP